MRIQLDLSRDSANSLLKNWKNRFWLRNRFIHNYLLPMLFPRNDGCYILREKWDNLIILDACRFDLFKQLYASEDLNGILESRTSRGTETKEFLSENFGKLDSLGDLVYVTASPWVTKHFNNKFHAIVPVWKNGWDEENGTVLPEVMYESAIEANERYPDKRLIIHFVQPHRPFIGYAKVDWWKERGAPPFRFRMVWGSVSEEGRSLLEVMDKETIRRFYERNLKLVLPFVRRLLEFLKGVTVVSADHGEALGEPLHPLLPFRVWGHPGHTRIPSLTTVPWFVFKSSTAKEVRKAETARAEFLPKEDEELINERLAALGYV